MPRGLKAPSHSKTIRIARRSVPGAQDAAEWGAPEGLNLVAFGGGVASTLTAFLVHSVFEGNNAVVFGCSSSSSSAAQRERAQQLAECLGEPCAEGAATSRVHGRVFE